MYHQHIDLGRIALICGYGDYSDSTTRTGHSSNRLVIHTYFPPRSASICTYNCPRATCINQHRTSHSVNIDAYHWECRIHILVVENDGTHAFSSCSFPEQFSAQRPWLAPCFALSAVLCEVTFNVTPITGPIVARAAPGTTME